MGWFKSRGARANFDQYVRPLAGSLANPLPVRYLELGCWRGESAAWAAINLLAHPASRGLGVDPWVELPGHPQESMDANCASARTRLAPFLRFAFVREFSSVWLRAQTVQHAWDVIYIDGEHTAPWVLDDAILSWPLLRVGGLLIFDDFANPRGRVNHVEHAVAAFRVVYDRFTEVVYQNNQIAFRKTSEAVSQDSASVGVRLRPVARLCG